MRKAHVLGAPVWGAGLLHFFAQSILWAPAFIG